MSAPLDDRYKKAVLSMPWCPKCEEPLDHACARCGARVCVTKHCTPHTCGGAAA